MSTAPCLRRNNEEPNAPWVVQKFGGTSVGKFPVNIARDIVGCVACLCAFHTFLTCPKLLHFVK